MTPEEISLSQQLAAHPKWTWAEGIFYITTHGGGFPWVKPGNICCLTSLSRIEDDLAEGLLLDSYPIIDHPATQGVLLSKVIAAGWRVGPVAEIESAPGKYAYWRQRPFKIWKDVNSYGAALAAAWLKAHP